MQRKGPLPPSVAPLVLSSAAVVDLILLWCVAQFLRPLLPRDLGVVSDYVSPAFVGVVLFLVLIPNFWFVCEILLDGRTPGRSVLGLFLADPSMKVLPRGRKLSRGVRKITTFGLSGINPFRPAGYDRATGATWVSAMSPGKPRPVGDWQILFKSGSLRGKKSRLSRIPSFAKTGRIRLGRNRNWADIPLAGAGDGSVSGQHCVLFQRDGRLYLKDGDGTGRPSSNGTFVDGRRLKPGETRSLSQARNFALADVQVELRK